MAATDDFHTHKYKCNHFSDTEASGTNLNCTKSSVLPQYITRSAGKPWNACTFCRWPPELTCSEKLPQNAATRPWPSTTTPSAFYMYRMWKSAVNCKVKNGELRRGVSHVHIVWKVEINEESKYLHDHIRSCSHSPRALFSHVRNVKKK